MWRRKSSILTKIEFTYSVMTMVGGVVQSVLWVASMRQISCLTHYYIINISSRSHHLSTRARLCDWCVILQEVRLRYFSFLTLLQSFEVRSTLAMRVCLGRKEPPYLRRFLSPPAREPLFRVFSSVFARSLSYVLYSNFDSRIASCCLFIRSLFPDFC